MTELDITNEALWLETVSGAVNESSILPDVGGRRVMNGTLGVQKLKPQADGSVPTPSALHFALWCPVART